MLISDLCVACVHVKCIRLYMRLDAAAAEMHHGTHFMSCDCHSMNVGHLSKLMLNVVAYA